MKNKMHVLATGALICLLAAVSSFGVKAEELVDEHSVQQTDFNLRVYELLMDADLEELEAFVGEVQDCPKDIPANNLEYWCTEERADNNKYVQHVRENKQWWKESQQIISIDRGLYIALTEQYEELYGISAKKFDIRNYRDFYGKYRGTWLEPRVEETLTQLWQDGAAYRGSIAASPINGKQIYNALYISHKIPFTDPFKYVGKHVYIEKYSTRNNHRRFGKRLAEMRQRSEETDSLPLLYLIKREWRDSILAPETQEESAYYEGVKQKRMFEFFDETGWAMFSDKDNPPTDWERHTVSLYCRVCPRKYSETVCDRFIKGAKKYGYYDERVGLTPQEYAAKQARLNRPKGR